MPGLLVRFGFGRIRSGCVDVGFGFDANRENGPANPEGEPEHEEHQDSDGNCERPIGAFEHSGEEDQTNEQNRDTNQAALHSGLVVHLWDSSRVEGSRDLVLGSLAFLSCIPARAAARVEACKRVREVKVQILVETKRSAVAVEKKGHPWKFQVGSVSSVSIVPRAGARSHEE